MELITLSNMLTFIIALFLIWQTISSLFIPAIRQRLKKLWSYGLIVLAALTIFTSYIALESMPVEKALTNAANAISNGAAIYEVEEKLNYDLLSSSNNVEGMMLKLEKDNLVAEYELKQEPILITAMSKLNVHLTQKKIQLYNED